MEYNITTPDLQNDLLGEALRALSECYAAIDAELYVVGATARDIALRLLNVDDTPRRTLDLDVAVALSDWSQYQSLTDTLLQHGFVKAQELQRFYYTGLNGASHYEVDIVPFGAIEYDGTIAWPPEGSPVMSVRCFSDVMRHADRVTVDGSFSFRLASLSGLFLLKLDTWGDRRLSTRKDAADMVYILQQAYMAYAWSRNGLPQDIDTETSTFDTTVAGAEWIASDLKDILSPGNRRLYADLLHNEADKAEESPLLNDMLDMSSSRNYESLRRALTRMAEILA